MTRGMTPARCPADPRLPGLSLLLDESAAAGLLARSAPAVVDELEILAVRYKPRRRLVVEYDVTTGGQRTTAVALLDRKVALGEEAAFVQWWPFDGALPALSLGTAELASRLGIVAGEARRLGYK